GAGGRAAAGQGEAGRRRVGGVAVDGDRLGVHQRAVVEQREGDAAGQIGRAAGRERVGQGDGAGAQRGRDRGGDGGERWGDVADCRLFVGVVVVNGGVVVGVAAVAGVPLVGAGGRAAAGQGEAGRRRVGGVAVDGDRLGVHQRAVVEQREGDAAG